MSATAAPLASVGHPLEVVSAQIGVGSALGPFVVNATTPHQLQIYVLSNTNGSHPFRPVADIARTGIEVNGIVFKDVKIRRDPVDENNDGIPDAIITITPRSALDLAPGNASLTVSGPTRPGTPFAHESWEGTAQISVTGAESNQPFRAYVALTLPQATPSFSLSFTLTTTPGNDKGQSLTWSGHISTNMTRNWRTASLTGLHQFVFRAFGPPVTIGDMGAVPYGTDPSKVPNYDLVLVNPQRNEYKLVPDPIHPTVVFRP
jgi:hypothetical protein